MKEIKRESLAMERERLERLEREGALEDLPFTALRRYAKEPSQVYALRIPVSRLAALRALAGARGEQPTALLREWVLERLDTELGASPHASSFKSAARSRETKKSSRVKRSSKGGRYVSNSGKAVRAAKRTAARAAEPKAKRSRAEARDGK